MSLEAVAWALKQRVGDPIAKLVLIGLANHHNDVTDECMVSKAQLAIVAVCNEKTVMRKTTDLVRQGWVTVEYRFHDTGAQSCNCYRIVFKRGAS